MTPSITEKMVNTALHSALVAMLPSTVEVIIAQQNKVPEPRVPDFVVMTPLRRPRLSTNVDSWADVRFTAAIAGTAMTVSDVDFGTILVGATVFGVGVAAGTTVISQTSGAAGGAGVYVVSVSQTVPSGVLACGGGQIEQSTEAVYQLDFHGPSSADNAQTVSTLMKDSYGVDLFAAQSPSVAVPLYADDPAQRPFLNESQQYENRWVVECALEIKPVVSVPQQYADVVEVDVISVDATYPP